MLRTRLASLLLSGLLLPTLACRPSLRADLDRIRTEIEDLERDVPSDAPLWITREDVANRPELAEAGAFDDAVQDHTSGVPDFLYFHVLEKLTRMTDNEITARSQGDFSIEACRQEPSAFRGKIWRVVGVAAALQREEISTAGAPFPEVFTGVCSSGPDQPVLFHLAGKPEVLYLRQDTVEFHGVFVKLLSHTSGERTLSVPLFLVKSLRKYL